MNEISSSVVREFANYFLLMYREDKREAKSILLGSFIICFSNLDIFDRGVIFQAVCLLVKNIGVETFEDKNDFLSFLQETMSKFLEKETNKE
jgi:hypothetical protein